MKDSLLTQKVHTQKTARSPRGIARANNNLMEGFIDADQARRYIRHDMSISAWYGVTGPMGINPVTVDDRFIVAGQRHLTDQSAPLYMGRLSLIDAEFDKLTYFRHEEERKTLNMVEAYVGPLIVAELVTDNLKSVGAYVAISYPLNPAYFSNHLNRATFTTL